jgi:hypothetical protein
MLVVVSGALEAGLPVSQIDPDHGALVLQPPERSKHGREVSGHPAIGQSIPQLLDRPVVARLLVEHLGQGGANVAWPCDGGDNNASSLRNYCVLAAGAIERRRPVLGRTQQPAVERDHGTREVRRAL